VGDWVKFSTKKCFLFALIIIISVSLLFSCTTASSTARSTLSQASSSESGQSSLPSAVSSESSAVQTSNVSGQLKAHFIDVGQGDSEFIELPDGKTMLIDAGVPEAGSTVVSYIKQTGYNKIDYLVATHPHEDHIGGMAQIIKTFNIGSIYMPKASTNTKTYENLLQTIKDKGLTIKTAQAGVQIEDGVVILAPVAGAKYDDLNQYSAVIRITDGNTHFLFMGDAGKPVEPLLTGDISADVLKVGHHGSDTASSPAFIAKVHPKIAIISCALHNDYGHPHQVTLDTLNAAGTAIYGTYASGTITVTSDGNKISIDKQPIGIAATSAAPAAAATAAASSSQSASTAAVPTSKTTASAVAQAPSATITADSDSGNGSDIVYITKTGSKYHRDGCSSLSKSKIPIAREEAIAKGYTPCEKCNP
jgi:Predicted hydrolase (metallo-beta-lactamase superfamily)